MTEEQIAFTLIYLPYIQVVDETAHEEATQLDMEAAINVVQHG
jgi:hypothetical protein